MMKSSEFVDRLINKYVKDEELKRLLIAHSVCVAEKALEVADNCGMGADIDRQFVWDASMLHDIGIVKCDAPSIHCHGKLPYICHGIAGGEILRREGVAEKYCRVCERHTGAGITTEDIDEQKLPLPPGHYLPETLEEKLICYADKFYSKSGDPAVEKSRESVLASMTRHGEAALCRFLELEHLFSMKC